MLNIGNNGRLGNQIFQYIFLKIYSKLNNLEVKLPPNQNFILNKLFDLNYKSLNHFDKIEMNHFEPFFHFNKKIYSIKRNISINFNGWFQSLKYFQKYKNYVLQELKFKKNILVQSQKFINKYKKNNNTIIGVHIRLTDYLKIPFKNIYNNFLLDDKLRNLIFNYFQKKYKNCIFLIFSDNINFCKNNIKGNNIFYSNNNYLIDFCSLSLCDHNIITSSTFSWWASYLNKNIKKEIFIVKPWFQKTSKCFNMFYKDYYKNFKVELYLKNHICYDSKNILK